MEPAHAVQHKAADELRARKAEAVQSDIAHIQAAIRALVERYQGLEVVVQSRVGRHEVAPLMDSVIEPFRTRVELTLKEYSNMIANTNAAAAATAASVAASRNETAVSQPRVLVRARSEASLITHGGAVQEKENVDNLSTVHADAYSLATRSLVLDEVQRQTRDALHGLEGRLETRWDLRLSQLQERITVRRTCRRELVPATVFMTCACYRARRRRRWSSSTRTGVSWNGSWKKCTNTCSRCGSLHLLGSTSPSH